MDLFGDVKLKDHSLRGLAQQVISFAGIGLIATLLQYLILILLVQLFSIKPVYASTIGYFSSALLSYYLNYVFTFSSSAKHHIAVTKFFVVVAIGMSLNAVMMYLLTEKLSVFYIVAQVMTTGVVFIWNFIGSRLWAFK